MVRQYLDLIDKRKRILEIGPLAFPLIYKQEGDNIFYADIRSTEKIKEFYSNNEAIPQENIVNIDYVINKSYSEDLKNIEPFDFVVMSHVIEHIPELIKFFTDISNVLAVNGKLFLMIPDKRYCFDHYRCSTSFAECYDIYRREIKNNPLRVLDDTLSHSLNDPSFWWENPTNFTKLPKVQKHSLDRYERALNGEYIDVHFSVFTPESFLLILYYMTNLRLLPFKVTNFEVTEKNSHEFSVVLEKDTLLLEEESIFADIEVKNLRNLLEKYSDIKSSEDSNKIYKALDSMLLFARNMEKERKNIVIWGAGQGGIKSFEVLEHYGIEIHAFLDNSPEKIGTIIKRLPVFSPEVLNSDPLWNKSHCAVFIASTAHVEIMRQLDIVGWKKNEKNNDYFVIATEILEYNFFPICICRPI